MSADAARPWSGRTLHFVGIGGAGMSGLALIAARLGADVSGSDRSDSAYLSPLRAAGARVLIGDHAAANVPAGAEVVYSTAVGHENPERVAARGDGGGGERHRSELLAEIASLKRCIAVSGTHGKTTSTGMIVDVLRGCGLDPAYAIGGELRSTGLNAAWGEGEWIVVEADESDRSLLNLDPEIVVLTNAELDHHATYGSLRELEDTFAQFAARARVAAVWDRPRLREIVAGAGSVEPFDAADVVSAPGGTSFMWRGRHVSIGVPGVHNAVNAAGALTAAAAAGADPDAAISAIAAFRGTRRRLELLGRSPSGAVVYDDYAHHPTEVAAALAAARSLGPGRLVAVFQPHLYSRTRALAREFGAALGAADLVGVVDVYPARERAEDFAGVDGHLVAAAAADAAEGRPVAWVRTLDDARRWLTGVLRDGDLCVVMGAGHIDSLGRALVA